MKRLIPVECLDQTARWPTGCESVTAVMLLRTLGAACTVERWVAEAIECRPFFEQDGRLFGPDPHRYFAGAPQDADGMGCYPPVIAAGLNRLFAAHGMALRAVDATSRPMGELLASIDRGIPVPFWATIDLLPHRPGPSWILEDSGETFIWRSNEHCMLLTGYDETHYWFCDPLHAENGPVAYPRSLVEQRHLEQLEMAVLVFPCSEG